jgi:hypothetical protein
MEREPVVAGIEQDAVIGQEVGTLYGPGGLVWQAHVKRAVGHGVSGIVEQFSGGEGLLTGGGVGHCDLHGVQASGGSDYELRAEGINVAHNRCASVE